MEKKIDYQACQELGKTLSKEIKAKVDAGCYDFVEEQIMEDLAECQESLEVKEQYVQGIIQFFLLKSPRPYFEIMGFRLAFVKGYHRTRGQRRLLNAEFVSELYEFSKEAVAYEQELQSANQ